MPPILPPDALDGFATAIKSKRKTRFGGGLRQRWKDENGTIYEWDYQHGHVEVYDARGNHKGAYDAISGQQVSEADSTRRVEP